MPEKKQVPDENSEQKYTNIQKLEQKLDKSENESRMFFFKEGTWKDWVY